MKPPGLLTVLLSRPVHLLSPGLEGDSFLAVGHVVHSDNLRSGVTSVSSDPLDLNPGVHMIHLGRSFRTGWLKVDDHKNKSIISPGKLVGLNVLSEFYVSSDSECAPALWPIGADFQKGF